MAAFKITEPGFYKTSKGDWAEVVGMSAGRMLRNEEYKILARFSRTWTEGEGL